MKYKVGDLVKIKNEEELIKLGTWYEECAKECGGKQYKITEILENSYRSGNITFDEESIEFLVCKEEYTFEELKRRVEDIKGYLSRYVSKNRYLVDVVIETNLDYYGYAKSRINIMD